MGTIMKRRQFISAVLGGAAALALSGAAFAQSTQSKALVDAGKAAGAVGEQSDGYLGFVTSASDPALKAAVEEINAGRAQLYRDAAARNNVTPKAAGEAAFVQVVRSKIKPGEYYRTPDGAWARK
jgi:uncharacterized protein YdbL (DUF1318 family)